MHHFYGCCGNQFVIPPCGAGPYEEICGGAFFERLDEDLVVAPFDLEGRTACSCKRHRFGKLDNSEMIHRRLYSRHLSAVGILRLDPLERSGEKKDQKRSHGLHVVSPSEYRGQKAEFSTRPSGFAGLVLGGTMEV